MLRFSGRANPRGNQPNKSGKPRERNEETNLRQNHAKPAEFADERKRKAYGHNPLGQQLTQAGGDRYTSWQKTERDGESCAAER